MQYRFGTCKVCAPKYEHSQITHLLLFKHTPNFHPTKKIAKANLALAKTGHSQNAASLPSVRGTRRARHHNLIVLSFRYGSSSRTSLPLY